MFLSSIRRPESPLIQPGRLIDWYIATILCYFPCMNTYKVDVKLNQAVRSLTEEFSPKKVYLFGSRAKGSHHESSDYDILLVVEKSELSKRERMVKALECLWGQNIQADVFVYTEAEFDEWAEEFNTVPYNVKREGVELKVG